MLITIADVSRAHFYADAVRDVYVRLPSEDPKTKQPGVCGKLLKTMYGSLDAAQRWGEHYAQVLEKGGCTRGVASPCHFFHKDLETYILVHGDDFFIVGRQEGREHVLRLLRSAYELSKVVTLGPGPSQSRTATILGRTLTLRRWGIEYEPDQQHVSRALKALGLTGAKGVGTPGTDDVGGPKASEISEMRKTAKWHNPPEEVSEEDDLLIGEELKLFQSVSGQILLYSVKELMRKMASPRAQDLIALKRVARYTIKYPRMACRYPWTPPSFFCRAVIVASMNDFLASSGTVALAKSSADMSNCSWSSRRRRISFVHPPGPGAHPEGSVWRHFTNSCLSNWSVDSGTKSQTACGMGLACLHRSLPLQLFQRGRILGCQWSSCKFMPRS